MSTLIESLYKLSIDFERESKDISSLDELETLRLKYLSKNGLLAFLTLLMRDIPKEDKPLVGKELNIVKEQLENAYNQVKEKLDKELFDKQLKESKIDVTQRGVDFNLGTIHPLTRLTWEIEDIFLSLGFSICDGPELESDHYNFDLLGIPKNHPARTMHDSFYVNDTLLLRTHTSPVQVRVMEQSHQKEIRIIAPGKTYRRDTDDSTHSHQFMQMEGLVVGKDVSFANLLYYLEVIAKRIFSEESKIRLRPSYFPFTEPSVEVDVLITKNGISRYIEVLGAGMVSPEVLRHGGYDSKIYNGFAFGVGLERIAMIKYGIDNIKHFYNNDIRFLRQFRGVR